MQLLGVVLLFAVIGIGFRDRNMTAVAIFDLHAFLMVLLGSTAAVLLSSSPRTALKTITSLREFVPGIRIFGKFTQKMEEELAEISKLWREGKKTVALDLAERSAFASSKEVVSLLLKRGAEASSARVFLEMKHAEIEKWQPAVHNWEMLAKLGPSFGMVGTITGMIQLFRNMNADNLNIGAAMSLALTATLYGVAFGAGIAGPVGHYLNLLLDERLGFLERCEKGVNSILSENLE